ncbi:MAG TPA: hypothetical protein VES66_09600 [Terriglobales bacterium]|nr:hypothetical protein [Terriglobales bacterium]
MADEPTAGATLSALHYLFTHSGKKIVAHCLELDIVTSGPNVEQAEESLNTLVLYQISSCFVSGNFGQLSFKAPIEYWRLHRSAKPLPGAAELQVEIPPMVLPVSRSFGLPVYRAEMAAAAA